MKVKVTKHGNPYSGYVLCIYPILSAHTQQWTHTHTLWVWTHPEQWAAIFASAPEEQLGVRCLVQGHLSRSSDGGDRECWLFLNSLLSYRQNSGQQLFLSLGFCSFSLSDIEQMCHNWYTWKGKQSSETEPSILAGDHHMDIVLHSKSNLVPPSLRPLEWKHFCFGCFVLKMPV